MSCGCHGPLILTCLACKEPVPGKLVHAHQCLRAVLRCASYRCYKHFWQSCKSVLEGSNTATVTALIHLFCLHHTPPATCSSMTLQWNLASRSFLL
jgi:hypothetical protein